MNDGQMWQIKKFKDDEIEKKNHFHKLFQIKKIYSNKKNKVQSWYKNQIKSNSKE
jgi:hypothetical protein